MGVEPTKHISEAFSTLPEATVSELFLKYLKLEGVDKIFGVPGAAIKYILNEIRNQDEVEYVLCRQETGAGFVADGYYRVSGKMGCVMVTSGPGAMNAVNGAVNADVCLSEMLVVTGEVKQDVFGRGWEQEGIDASLNVMGVYKNAVSMSSLATNAENFQTMMTTSLRVARAIPGRAAHISLPDDVQNMTAKDVKFPKTPANYRAESHARMPDVAAQVMRELSEAKRPLIFLGNGCRKPLRNGGLAGLQAMAERFGIPVMTTLDGKGLFPEGHELSLRAYGKSGCLWPAYYMRPPEEAPDSQPFDYLLVVGSQLDEFSTNLWNTNIYPDGPMVQVDVRQESIARGMPISRAVVAEAGAFFTDMVSASQDLQPDVETMLTRKDYLGWIKENHSPYDNPDARKSNADPIRPERVMAMVSDMIPDGGHIFVDAGNSCGWCSHYLEINPPTQVHAALELGTMGYAVGAVVGAKIAAPEAVCVAVCGDGGFMMQGNEVSTAVQHKAGAIWIVWNENDYNMVSQGMGVIFKDPKEYDHYYRMGNPDIEMMAKGMGANATTVTSPAAFEAAFADAVAKSGEGVPHVIVVQEDPNAAPPFYKTQFPWLEAKK